jgi:hypothetical protein
LPTPCPLVCEVSRKDWNTWCRVPFSYQPVCWPSRGDS